MESTIILFILALILNIPPIILINSFKKDRKKYFIVSSIYVILVSFLIFKFGVNILGLFGLKQGVINYTIYVYKNSFIFSPLLGLFFVSLHKLFAQKKQLILLIALKYILPILVGLIFMNFLKISHLLWLLSGLDILTTIISIIISINIKSFQK